MQSVPCHKNWLNFSLETLKQGTNFWNCFAVFTFFWIMLSILLKASVSPPGNSRGPQSSGDFPSSSREGTPYFLSWSGSIFVWHSTEERAALLPKHTQTSYNTGTCIKNLLYRANYTYWCLKIVLRVFV